MFRQTRHPRPLRDEGHGSALAPGDYQCLAASQIVWRAHFLRGNAQGSECGDVLRERPLQGEDSDHFCFCSSLCVCA